MEDQKIEIKICLGSSCFARGNKKMVQIVQKFLDQNQLEEKVIFHGSHCLGHCGEGPMIQIGETLFQSGDAIEVTRLLKKYFGL